MKLFSVRRMALRYAWRNRRRLVAAATATGAGALAWAQRLLGMQSVTIRISELVLRINGHGARGWCTLSPYLVLGLQPVSQAAAAAGTTPTPPAGMLQQAQRTRHAAKANYCEDLAVHFPGSLTFTASGSPASAVLGMELMARRDFLLPPRRVAYGELPLLALFAGGGEPAPAHQQHQAHGHGHHHDEDGFDSWIDMYAAPEAADRGAAVAAGAATGQRFARVHVHCSVVATATSAAVPAATASAGLASASASAPAAGGAGQPSALGGSAAAAGAQQSATETAPVVVRDADAAAAGRRGAEGLEESASSRAPSLAAAHGSGNEDEAAPPSLAPIVATAATRAAVEPGPLQPLSAEVGGANAGAAGGAGAGGAGMMAALLRLGGNGAPAGSGSGGRSPFHSSAATAAASGTAPKQGQRQQAQQQVRSGQPGPPIAQHAATTAAPAGPHTAGTAASDDELRGVDVSQIPFARVVGAPSAAGTSSASSSGGGRSGQGSGSLSGSGSRRSV